MKSNLTDISVILDRSGSMQSIKEDTIGGFNSFLDSQKWLDGECNFSLIQFDNMYEENYIGIDIQKAMPLNNSTYMPRGSTALLDAIGKTINNVGIRLNRLFEDQKPSKVMIIIITDGYENSSSEFSKEQIKDMITTQEDVYKWEIIFLGANMDAIAEGAKLGTKVEKSMKWGTNSDSIKGTYSSLSTVAMNYRNSNIAPEFTVAQRTLSDQ